MRASKRKRTAGSASLRRTNHTSTTTDAISAHHQWRNPVPRKMTTCVGQRQRLAGLRERLLELRHDPDEQHHHRQDSDADQDARIDERRLHALAQLLVALHRIGEARQHHAERAAGLARPHDVDVEAGKHVAPRVERLRQRLAAADVVPDLLQERRRRRRRREPDQDLERAIEREPRLQQRRELAGHRQQLLASDGLRREPAPPRRRLRASPARAGAWRRSPAPPASAACPGRASVRRSRFRSRRRARRWPPRRPH